MIFDVFESFLRTGHHAVGQRRLIARAQLRETSAGNGQKTLAQDSPHDWKEVGSQFSTTVLSAAMMLSP